MKFSESSAPLDDVPVNQFITLPSRGRKRGGRRGERDERERVPGKMEKLLLFSL